MFVVEAEKFMGNWDVYGSGGGCYHAMKEFITLKGNKVAVEIHGEHGGAQMYHDGEMNLCNAEEVAEDDNWSNYILLSWIVINYDNPKEQDYDDIKVTDMISVFDESIQKEIIEKMKAFAKFYDEYMYN